jgi:hypothetical protein
MATLGRAPLRIDILNSISGVTFREAWRTRVRGQLADLPVSYISRQLLIRNKLASGRVKDALDVELLREAAPSRRRR